MSHSTDQFLTAEHLWTSLNLEEGKTLQTHVSTASQPVCARSTVTVSGFEERGRANMLTVQDPGFTLKSTVTGAMWFSAHVVLNRMELLCHVRSTQVRSTFCHVRLIHHKTPPTLCACVTTFSTCFHASRFFRLVSVLASRSSQLVSHLFFFKLRETWLLLDNIDHCTRLVVINPRHCVRHDNFIVLSDFSKFPTLPGNTSQSSARFLVDLSLCLQNFSATSHDAFQHFTAIYQDALQNCLGNLSRCSCAQCLD